MDMDEKISVDSVISSKQPDFEEIWFRIATDIKIRKFDNLDDIPEFHDLPDQLQNQLKSAVTKLNDNHEIFYNEQELTNFHVILFVKRKDKYLAIYEDQTQVQQLRSIVDRMGLKKTFQLAGKLINKDSGEIQTTNNGCQRPSESVEKETLTNDCQTSSESDGKQTSNDDTQTRTESVEKKDLHNATSSNLWNILPKVLNFDLWSYIPFLSKNGSSTPALPYNKLIHVCMLHKLESISNCQ